VIVLENCSVAFDEDGSGVFAFVVTFSGDQDRHVFSCFSVNQAQNWVIALRQAR
jgi:microcompartment protein CcmK/EutM